MSREGASPPPRSVSSECSPEHSPVGTLWSISGPLTCCPSCRVCLRQADAVCEERVRNVSGTCQFYRVAGFGQTKWAA